MTTPMPDNPPPISAALRRDLSMVLPTVEQAKTAEIKAYLDGRPVGMDQATSWATLLFQKCIAPAVTGLNGLSIEAIREAIALTERVRGCVLPLPMREPAAAQMNVMQTATLGHAASADLRVAFREDATRLNSPIDEWITQRVPNTLFVDGGDFDSLLRLHAKVREHGAAAFEGMTALPVRSVVVTLPAEVDPRIEMQWHAMAADAQQSIRICVMTLPDLRTAGNQRGVIETLTWQTGLAASTGGVTFADGAPRPCGGAMTLLMRGAIDVVIDAGLEPLPPSWCTRVKHRVRIGPAVDPNATLSIVTPGLAAGLRAQVMRFDGTLLWLCDDPSPTGDASDDPAIGLFSNWNRMLS